MPQSVFAPGLTTGDAPFVEQARDRGELYISQAYDLYSEENHESWRRLYDRIRPRWERYANDHFLRGIEALHLPSDRIPRLSEINRRLQPLTGFQTRPVSGYVPGFLFFDCLRRREFPTTITIRPADKMDYLPEPDIFHDVAGHVPMHTQKAFADTLDRFERLMRQGKLSNVAPGLPEINPNDLPSFLDAGQSVDADQGRHQSSHAGQSL